MNKNNITTYFLIDEDSNVYQCKICKYEFYITDGTPLENHINFCPCCGRKIK